MSHELMYTSAPAGLRQGSSGFCTVCATEDIPRELQQQLEAMSAYRHVVPPGAAVHVTNPVCWQHVLVNVNDTHYSVLSRIADAGLDHQQRLNVFAHHVALPRRDCPAGNPASALMQPRFMEHRWDGELRHIEVGKLPATGSSKPAIAQAWKQQTGDAGWAGVLAESIQLKSGKPCYLIFDLGTNVLPLFQEAIALLPREQQWKTTFTTYFQGPIEGVQCAWRAVLRDSVEARQLIAGKHLVIDLASARQAPDTPWTALARTGQKPTTPPVDPLETAPPFQLHEASAGPDDEPMEPIPLDEDAPPILKPVKKRKPAAKLVNKQLFPKPVLDKEVDDEESPQSSRQPYIFAGVMVLLLVVGVIAAFMAYLNASSTKQQQAQATEAKNPPPPAGNPIKGNFNDPPVNQNPNQNQQEDENEQNRINPAKLPNEGDVNPPPQQVVPLDPRRGNPPPGDQPNRGNQGGKPGPLVAVELGVPAMGAMQVAPPPDQLGNGKQTLPIQPVRQPPRNDAMLIPVRYHLLPAEDKLAGNVIVLATNMPFCRSIRVLSNQVFTDTPIELTLRNSTYVLKSFADQLRISRKEAGRTFELADIVRQAEQLVLKPTGNAKLQPAELKNLKLLLMDTPLLCEVGDNQFELQGFYSVNSLLDTQPRKALELTVIKQPALTPGKEFTVSLKPSYDLFELINPRMACFGAENRRLLEVELATGKQEVLNDAKAQLVDIAPCRRLVRLQREFDFFSTPQVARFSAVVRFDGELPDRSRLADDGHFQRAIQELERETDKQSPHYIILPEVKVLAHFTDRTGKKLSFLVWQTKP